jgi:hypothetical protein
MHRAFIYGPRMRGMAHAGQFEPSPRNPPPPYPAAPYANLRTPGGSGRVRIVILRGVFAPLPRPLGISLSTLRAIRNLTQLPQNNRNHQILIDTLSGVLAPAPGERERRHPGPGKPARFAPRDGVALRAQRRSSASCRRFGRGRGHHLPTAPAPSDRDPGPHHPKKSQRAADDYLHAARIASGSDAVRARFCAAVNCHRRTRRADAVVALPRHSCAAAHYRRVARIASAPDAVRARFCPRARRAPAPISNPLPAIRKQRKPLKTKPK